MPVQTRQQKRRLLAAAQAVRVQPAAVRGDAAPAPAPAKAEERRREECAICLEPAGCWPHRLRCGHAFHGACLRDWVDFSPAEARCPVCRGPVRPAPWQHAFNHGFLAWGRVPPLPGVDG